MLTSIFHWGILPSITSLQCRRFLRPSSQTLSLVQALSRNPKREEEFSPAQKYACFEGCITNGNSLVVANFVSFRGPAWNECDLAHLESISRTTSRLLLDLTRVVFAWKDDLDDERGCILLIDDGQEANRKATYFVIRAGRSSCTRATSCELVLLS